MAREERGERGLVSNPKAETAGSPSLGLLSQAPGRSYHGLWCTEELSGRRIRAVFSEAKRIAIMEIEAEDNFQRDRGKISHAAHRVYFVIAAEEIADDLSNDSGER